MVVKKYAIVKRTGEKDVLIATLMAESLERADALANERFAKEKESLKRGEAMLVVELDDEVVFDADERVVNTSGNMNMFYKF